MPAIRLKVLFPLPEQSLRLFNFVGRPSYEGLRVSAPHEFTYFHRRMVAIETCPYPGGSLTLPKTALLFKLFVVNSPPM